MSALPASNPPAGRPAAANPAPPELLIRLGIDDINLILEAVGNLPFAKVYALVAKIQQQAAEQLQAVQGPPGATLPAPGR